MQDHLQARLVYKCNEPTLNDEVSSLMGQAKIGLKYLMFRAGPMTMAASLATGFMKTRDDLETPDIQFHVQPLSAENPGKGADKFSAFTMSVCQLSTKTDCDTVVEGVNIARRIARHAPLTSKISQEFRPHADLPMDDYDQTLDWARNNTASIYHPTGTCKMGSDAVADCSIMPEIVSGNTNAPAIMIGEKASDLILEDARA